MALSGNFSNYPSTYLGLYCTWSATQSVTGNYSDVTLKVYLKYASLYVGARDDCTISINGTSETYSSPAISEDDTSTTHSKLLKTKKVRVNHNSDGTKTGVKLSASWRFDGTYSGTYIGTITASATISLNSIDRTAPTVKCSVSSITANGFKISATSSAKADVWQYSLDGGSSWTKFSTTEGTSASITLSSLTPNTSYSVRVGARKASNEVYGKSSTVSVKTLGGSTISSVETVEADTSSVSISFSATVYNASYTHSLTIKNGSTTYLTISNISFTKGTADRTITLTSTQRTNLLSKMSSLKSFTGTFVLTTYNGSTQIGSTSSDTATIKTTSSQSAPTMASFTYLDANSTTVNVTGNNQLFIQGYSSLQITPATATAKNQATIVSYSATCNGVTKSNTSGDVLTLGKISKSGSLTVEVKATDSRGYTVTKSTKITVIAYAKPKINSLSLRRTNNIEAEMQLTFDGSISPVTVSSTQKNNLTYVRYRYKKTSASSYGSYTSILSSVTKSGSSFSYSNLELCSLDSGSSYDFHIQIRDSLGSLSSLDLYYVVPQGTPLVALRKQKVGINTPSPEAALHVVGDVKITGTVSGSFAPSSLSSAVPISKGGTGATTAAGAAKNIINGQSITPKTIDITGGQYWINDVYGINMQNSDIVNLNGLYFQDAVDTQSEGINFYRSSTTWDRLYSNSGTLYYAPNCDHDTYPGTRYQIYHSGGATIPISKGGTGATSAADVRSNLGLACTSLYKGTLTSGSATFTYGSHKAYIIMGRPLDGSAICTLIVPKSMITTGGLKYQFADEVNYVAFTLSYSGTTGTVTISTRSGDGFISRVFGVN